MREIAQRGSVQILPLLLIIGAVGLISFLLVSSSAPFQDGLFSTIYQKPASRAASDPVIPQIYYLEQWPSQNVVMNVSPPNTGYAVFALLKDSQGNVVTNQQGIQYVWTVGPNTTVASVTPFSGCTNGIQAPCPNDHATIKGLTPGYTNVKVEVFSTTQGKIAESQFYVAVLAEALSAVEITSPNGNESYTVGQNANITWNVGILSIDYYNVYYEYYQFGVLHSGYIASPPWGSSSLAWVIPSGLQNQQVRIEIQAMKNGIIVGRDSSDKYFFVGGQFCADVLTSAVEISTNQCIQYPNSCIPAGWVRVPSCPALLGDLDGNRLVNIFDYNIIVGNFGKTGSGIPGDIDNNLKVDIFDYNIIVGNFGKQI